MKRIFSLALTLALALSLAAGASAAAEARLVRAFVYQDTLYTYVDISGADQPITKADAELCWLPLETAFPFWRRMCRQSSWPPGWRTSPWTRR